jgi:hypothetical protein
MNHTYKILKYLYKNNDGNYHAVQYAYRRKLPSRELLWDKIQELKILGYVFGKDILELRGLFDETGDYPRKYDTLEDEKHILYQVKITSKGEDYIDERTYRLGNFIFQRRNFIIVVLASIVAIITFIVNLIFQ